jgi:CHAD domain-containing protein
MKPPEPLGIRLQQFALAQLDAALAYLTEPQHDPDEAIHETRRCVKRVRALLRLVKSQLPATNYDRENLYLRNIGRQLTTLRDAAVMTKTLAALQKEQAAQLPRSIWRTLAKELETAQGQSRLARLAKKKRMAVVATRLRRARARVAKWALDFDDEAVLQQGLRQTFRRGKRAMEAALAEPTAENFHEWRKQVNHLRHQLQIVQSLKLGKVKATLRRFKSLAELLGRKNDLAVLSRHSQRLRRKAAAPARQALQDLVHTRDVALTAKAIKFGQQLYEPPSKAFLRQLWP